MNCAYFREMLSARIDGELSRDEEAALDEHLEGCDSCRKFAAAMAGMKEAAAGDKQEAMPAGLEEKILSQTIKASPKKESVLGFIKGYYRVPRGLAWAALVLLFILTVNSFRGVTDKDAGLTPSVEVSEHAFVIQRVTLTQDDIIMSKTTTSNNESL